MKNKMGKVILVGAGAGDTGLLTIKGKKYIEEADCIIYDRLASPELLGMAKHDCEWHLCRKRKSQAYHEARCDQ